jgi:hypothetical protein
MSKNERKMTAIQRSARNRKGGVKDGLVICENCDAPASLSGSMAVGWTGCGPCIFGEANSLDPEDFIAAEVQP